MKVIIGQGSCGIATGAKKTQAEFEAQIAKQGVNVDIDFTGCVGTCYLEPIVDVYDDLLEGNHGEDSDKKAESLRIIEEGSGTFFDPEIVSVFLKVQKQLHNE